MVQNNVDIFQKRRDVIVKGLRELGFDVRPPKGTFYLFFDIEGDSVKFAERMLEVGVVVTAGNGYGRCGEGFVRLALTQTEERIKEALERMSKVI